jgi:hypothetical protein
MVELVGTGVVKVVAPGSKTSSRGIVYDPVTVDVAVGAPVLVDTGLF